MAVSVIYYMKLLVDETLNINEDFASNPILSHELSPVVRGTADGSTAATAGTSGPVTKVYSDQIALSSGATIVLDALTQSTGGDITQTVDFTGLKIQFFLFENDPDNSNVMTVTFGASDGYQIFGGSAGKITLPVGCSIMGRFPDQLEDVATADSEIDITGTDTELFNVVLVAG